MIVGEPHVRGRDGRIRLSARFEFARRGPGPAEVWFGFPEELADRADQGADAFVPLATLLAAHLGDDLEVRGPVSPRLLAGARQAAATFAEWWGYREPRITAETVPVESRDEGVALLYSRGVDTAATLVRSLDGEIPERVTHLLCGDAIEWAFDDDAAAEIWADNERAAAEIGLPLVRLTSNARELLRGLIGWPRVYGAAYIGAALPLGPMFAHLLTGATQPMAAARREPPYEPEVPEPRGSRWDLDPLWSTEATEVRQDAAELNRAERVAIVARHQPSLRWLKVCWEGRARGNCGRCVKCLRTMTALASVGALEAAPFDRPLTAEAVRAAPLREMMPAITPAVVDSVPEQMPELRAAWEDKLREWERFKARHDRQVSRDRRRRALRRAMRRARRRGRRRARGARARARGAAGAILRHVRVPGRRR